MTLPTVSVVLPTRNRRALLAITLHSVLWQRSVDLEVIIVDEASTDDTHAMLDALDDARVRVVRHERPVGLSGARNHGAAEARGDWIAFIDDDDVWAPDKLTRQVQAIECGARDWAYTGSVSISEHAQIISGRPPLPPEEVMRVLPRYNAIPGGGSNVVMRRQTFVRAGPFETRLRTNEDWEMWIRLANIGPPACVSSPLLGYRVHAANASLDIDEMLRGARLIEQLHDTDVDWGRLHRWMAESCLRKQAHARALGQFARAAVKGQARGVASDLKAITLRHVARLIGYETSGDTRQHDGWIARARWLEALPRDASTHVNAASCDV